VSRRARQVVAFLAYWRSTAVISHVSLPATSTCTSNTRPPVEPDDAAQCGHRPARLVPICAAQGWTPPGLADAILLPHLSA